MKNIVNGVEVTHDRALSQSHDPVAQIAVFAEAPTDESLVEAIDLLKEGTVKGHVEPEDLGAVSASKQGAPFGFSVASPEIANLILLAQRFKNAGSDHLFIESDGGGFAETVSPSHMKTAGAVMMDVGADKGAGRNAVAIGEDQQIGIGTATNRLVENGIFAKAVVLMPDVVDIDAR